MPREKEEEQEGKREGVYRRMKEHHVLNHTSLVAVGCPSRHDAAVVAILGSGRGGGLPEYVRMQMEGRERVGRVRES